MKNKILIFCILITIPGTFLGYFIKNGMNNFSFANINLHDLFSSFVIAIIVSLVLFFYVYKGHKAQKG
jgi:hypothetical protein